MQQEQRIKMVSLSDRLDRELQCIQAKCEVLALLGGGAGELAERSLEVLLQDLHGNARAAERAFHELWGLIQGS
ncbi:MAG: hypothetical protein H7831_04590 [Magnetococcus sp. WYHC-3]